MKNTLYFIIMQIVILFIWSLGWFLIEIKIPANEAGVFGDQFGGITSLFTAVAFRGIVYSIIIQTRELLLTRQEFTKSTQAQTISSNALTSQLNIQKRVATISAITTLLKQYEDHDHLKLLDFGSLAEYAVKRAEYIKKIHLLLTEIQDFKTEVINE